MLTDNGRCASERFNICTSTTLFTVTPAAWHLRCRGRAIPFPLQRKADGGSPLHRLQRGVDPLDRCEWLLFEAALHLPCVSPLVESDPSPASA
jgi:hypothetical protein